MIEENSRRTRDEQREGGVLAGRLTMQRLLYCVDCDRLGHVRYCFRKSGHATQGASGKEQLGKMHLFLDITVTFIVLIYYLFV